MGFGEHRLFQREVGIEIDLGRLDRFVPEPDRDKGSVDPGLEEFHRGSVPKDVRSDSLLGQRPAGLLGLGDMPGNQPLDSVGAEASAT